MFDESPSTDADVSAYDAPQAEWQTLLEVGPVIDCAQTAAEIQDTNAPSVSFEDSAIYIGRASGNAVVARVDGDQVVFCVQHEMEMPDSRAEGLTWNGGDYAYVIYTIDNEGTSLENRGGWLPDPGRMGNVRVSYVGRISTIDGDLENGTFVIALLMEGDTNSTDPRAPLTILEDGSVEFLGESSYKPIDANGTTQMDCTEYPFDSRYRFSPDLSELVCADSSNCIPENPC